jgi:hypothetical protein
MTLNRRIVLEDSEICARKDPAARPPHAPPCDCDECIDIEKWNQRHQEFVEFRRAYPSCPCGCGDDFEKHLANRSLPNPWATEEVAAAVAETIAFQRRNALTALRNGSEPAITFDQFFATIGLDPERARRGPVCCSGCGRADSFDADVSKRTLQCLRCGRTTSFDQFKKEHS